MNKSILNKRGYFDRHLELCKTEKTQQDAYDVLEAEYFALTETNMHKTYEAFRMAKTRYYKNNRW